MRGKEVFFTGKQYALLFSVATLATGGILAGILASESNLIVVKAEKIERRAIDSPPLCPSLQGEDWRVISLGKNTLLIADVVRPVLEFPNSLMERQKRAEQTGLRSVLQHFEGKVLNVASEQDGLRHIVTVTDDRC